METKAVNINSGEVFSVDPGWKYFSTRILGVEISFNVPEEWIDHADPFLGQILFLLGDQQLLPNSEQTIPALNLQRQDTPQGSSLEEFTKFSIEQHKQLNNSESELNVIPTTLGGYEAAKAISKIKLPELMNEEGTVFQVWTKVHKYVFVLTFFCLNFNNKFKQQCNGVIKSFSFGNFRQEHVLMKTNQLINGFMLNSPITWLLEEETLPEGKTESRLFYKEEGKLKCQAKLITKLDNNVVLSDLTKDLKTHLLTFHHDTTITDEFACKLGVLDAYRVEFDINNCDHLPNKGILFIAKHSSEWFSGSIFLSFLYHHDEKSKSLATLDLCERAALSLELPIDPLDEDDRNLDLYTYENLNFGFKFKFNKDKYKPKVIGISAKMLPIRENPMMVQWPVPEISGSMCPQITKIHKIDDVSVTEFVEGIKELITKDPDAMITEITKMKIDGENAIKLVCVHKTLNVRLINFIFRKEGYWILLRAHSYNFESSDDVYINEIVNSFHYCGK